MSNTPNEAELKLATEICEYLRDVRGLTGFYDSHLAEIVAARRDEGELAKALETIANATMSDCDGENWMKRIARAALAQHEKA